MMSFSSSMMKMMKMRRWIAVRDFFRKMEPSEIQKKIVEIPFHVIISISPDRLLNDLL